jgi:hypothetical protein
MGLKFQHLIALTQKWRLSGLFNLCSPFKFHTWLSTYHKEKQHKLHLLHGSTERDGIHSYPLHPSKNETNRGLLRP